LHSWIHDKGSKHERAMTGTFYKPDVMVFGATTNEVMDAIDVLEGKKSNFASVQPAASGAIPAGAILLAGVTGVADVDLPCKCPIVKKLDAAIVAVGENSGSIFVQAKVLTKDSETAQQAKAVVDGAVALATLAKADDAEAMKVLKAVKVDVSDKLITVDGNAAIDAVWAHIQKAVAEAKKGHKPWPPCAGGHCPMKKK
jgi:hypothetical protein